MDLERIKEFCTQRSNIHKWKFEGDTKELSDELTLIYKLTCEERGNTYTPTTETEKNIKAVCRYLTDHTTRPSLLLTGTVGNGKTTMLRSILRLIKYHDNRLSTYYVKASSLGETMKQDPDTYKKIRSAQLLFIDDMGFYGSEKTHSYGDILHPIEDIIEYRYDRLMPIMATSNLSGGQIKDIYGERIYSRMCECFEILAFTCADFRTRKGAI